MFTSRMLFANALSFVAAMSASAESDLLAAFSVDVLSGPAPMVVQFSDRSAGAPDSWAWDLDGDGQNDSVLQDPIWVYEQEGRYSVALSVANEGGQDQVIHDRLIRHAGPSLVWTEDDRATLSLEARHWTAGGDTGPIVTLAQTDTGRTRQPDLAESDGRLYLTWSEDRAGRTLIYLQLSDDAGQSWQPRQLIASTEASLGPARLAAEGQNVFAAWRRQTESVSTLMTRISRDSGVTWNASFEIPGAAPSGNPRVTVSGLAVVAAWRGPGQDSEEFLISVSMDAGVSWSEPVVLPSSFNASGDAAIVMHGARITIAFSRVLAGRSQIWTSRSDDGGWNWLSQPLTQNQGDSTEPRIVAAGGQLHVVWTDRLSGTDRVYISSSDDAGVDWSAARRLVSTEARLADLFVAANDLQLSVLWSDARVGNREIYAKTSLDGGLEWSFNRLTHTGGHSGQPLWFGGDARIGSLLALRDDTVAQGLFYSGETFGASWGDADGDGWPDLYVSNHRDTHSLFLNRNGAADTSGFTPVDPDAWPDSAQTDTHGAVWVDLDADQDTDLLIQVGADRGVGEGPNLALINEAGFYVDRATDLGLDHPPGRGRTPGLGDFNHDGGMDIVLNTLKRSDGLAPPTIMLAETGGFIDGRALLGLDVAAARFSKLADLSGDRDAELIFAGSTLQAYETGSAPFVDITRALGLEDISAPTDIAIADFNGDGRADVYVTRLPYFTDEVARLADDAVGVYLSPGDPDVDRGVRFSTDGDVTFTFGPRVFTDLIDESEQVIFVGGSGANPDASTFTLASDDPVIDGVLPHSGSMEHAVYIGRETGTGEWVLFRYGPAPASAKVMRVFIQASSNITGYQAQALEPDEPANILLLGTDHGLHDATIGSGLDQLRGCGSIVAADLDNDTDVDLYVQCTSHLNDTADRIYLNRGMGTFDEASLPDATDASATGRGDTVTAADIDRDGFIDLFLTHGENGVPGNVGPYRLLRNHGGGSHWLQIDLRGVISNPAGVGATVEVVADGKSQFRYQDGGMHKYSQDHARLHFGLGAADTADSIIVRWPSGTEQSLGPVPADQLVILTEGDVEID